MSRDRLNVLQVGTAAVGGGAERVALSLHEEYLDRDLDAWLAVGSRAGMPRTVDLPNDERRGAWAQALVGAATKLRPSDPRSFGPRRLASRALRVAAEPVRYLRVLLGREDFDFPGTAALLRDIAPDAEVIHFHNLHGGYFDLRELPRLTAAVPSIVTLHDAWLLTGHCAHPFECRRWREGCGDCPHLDVYVPLARDASAENWRLKREIIARSRLNIATPSRWLMGVVEQSGVLDGQGDARVIPNGVDTRTFAHGDKREARETLGLPSDREIVMFAANALEHNPFKDFRTLLEALPLVAANRERQLLLVALGASGDAPSVPGVEVAALPFDPDPARVAMHLNAADLYVHPARAENFPLAILEAMACGIAVVASRVGGIPEIVEDGRTGALVDVGDAEGLARAITSLLDDDAKRTAYAEAGLARVRERFTLAQQADAYIGWYEELHGRDEQGRRSPDSPLRLGRTAASSPSA